MLGILINTGIFVFVEILLAFIFVVIRGLSFKDLLKILPISILLNLLVSVGYQLVMGMFIISTARIILGGLKLIVLLIEGLIYKKIIGDIGNGAFVVSAVLNIGSYLAFVLFLASLILG